jgi:hypothetical protein
MRRLLLVVVASLAGASAAIAAVGDPLDPKVAITKADQARARAALLRQSDLGPGWTNRSTAQPSSLKAPICPQIRPDYSKLTLTGHAESVFDNGNGGFQVISDVEVWKTVKQAEQHMGALLKPALPRCIRYSLLKSVGGTQGVTLLPTKARKLGKFAEVSVSYRVPVAIESGGQTFVVNSDYVFLRKGRTEVYINVTAPSTDEDQVTAFVTRLAKTLAARIRT